MSDRADMIAAHRELVEASNAVRHLLVIEHLTSEQVAEARSRLARAYEHAVEVGDEILYVRSRARPEVPSHRHQHHPPPP
jgi:hypothetical protein